MSYVDVNDLGTAVLLESVIGSRVRRLLVASSMSIYGEGLMLDSDGRGVETVERTVGPAPAAASGSRPARTAGHCNRFPRRKRSVRR